MSVTYVTNNNKPRWEQRCRSIAISSTSLDALMATTESKDDGNFSPEKPSFISKPLLKRSHSSSKCDEQKRIPINVTLTPTQVLKARRTVKDGNYSLDTRYCKSTPLSTSSSSLSSLDTSQGDSETSSVYLTPESKRTPIHFNTSDRDARQWPRRSFFDQNHSSPNSSLGNTSFYTPERSQSDCDSEVKIKRTRWSNSSNLISLSDSASSEYLSGSFASSEPVEDIQPELIGYQMVGDSQFCRFGQQLLGLQRVPAPNSPGRIGICVSGQTISDLHRRVKEKFYPISDKVILMIGTNDFLRQRHVMTMCQELSQLVRTLQETVSNIVLLTLPPVPKLEQKNSTRHFKLLEDYNSFIRSLEDGEKIRIADVSPLYMSPPPYQRCRMTLFETHFAGAARRMDLIHLNRQGLEVIRKYILEHFL